MNDDAILFLVTSLLMETVIGFFLTEDGDEGDARHGDEAVMTSLRCVNLLRQFCSLLSWRAASLAMLNYYNQLVYHNLCNFRMIL